MHSHIPEDTAFQPFYVLGIQVVGGLVQKAGYQASLKAASKKHLGALAPDSPVTSLSSPISVSPRARPTSSTLESII